MNVTLSDLLKKMLEMNGSDLHITTNSPPQIRVHGHLHPLDMPPLQPAETKQLGYSVLTDAQKHRFEENLELDFSFGLKGLARFRGNLFNQRGATGGVFRVIPFEIKSFQQLNLPAIIAKLSAANREFMHRYPGESARRQAVHTVYGGAHLFKAESPEKLGEVALQLRVANHGRRVQLQSKRHSCNDVAARPSRLEVALAIAEATFLGAK